jgi:hypothetical protein
MIGSALGHFTTDRRWIANESCTEAQAEIHVSRYPSTDGVRWPISNGGGVLPTWSSGSDRLFYVTRDGSLMEVPVDPRHPPGWLIRPGPCCLSGPSRCRRTEARVLAGDRRHAERESHRPQLPRARRVNSSRQFSTTLIRVTTCSCSTRLSIRNEPSGKTS